MTKCLCMRKKYTNTEFGNHHEVFKQVANIDQVQDNISQNLLKHVELNYQICTSEEITEFGIVRKLHLEIKEIQSTPEV